MVFGLPRERGGGGIGRGKLAKSNAEQVAKVRRLIEELGYQVATAKEARETLGLKGPDRTKF